MSGKIEYRRDIDGLRAIAVGLVVIYHAFPHALPGGFVGVDIFFVISGFLITGIISREIDDGSFTITRFYERRIRRIFPALIVVLLATLAAGWWLLLPSEFANLGMNAIAGAAFFSNIASMVQAGYFDLDAAKKPLLHLWSLGIEEQFYLAWPLILMVIARWSKHRMTVIAGLAVASFILNVSLIWSHPVSTFYSPLTRAWELLAGGMIIGGIVIADRRLANIASVCGMALISLATWLMTPKSAFPGWWAVLPVVGAMLLIMSPGSLAARWVLGSKPFVWIGLISYPLYLWHWPLLVFGEYIKQAVTVTALTDNEKWGLVALSVFLSGATYLVIERPFRHTKSRLRIAGLAGAMSVLAGAGLVILNMDGLPQRFPATIQAIAKERVDPARWRIGECMLNIGQTGFVDSCSQPGQPSIFLWGDSTAGALSPGMLDLQKVRSFAFSQYTISSCEPLLPKFSLSDRRDCPDRNRQALAALVKRMPETVVLAAIWYPTPEHLNALAETVQAIKGLGIRRVVVLGRVPVWPQGLQNRVVNYFLVNRSIPDRLKQPAGENWYDAKMRAAVEPAGADFVSLWDILCNEDGCLASLRKKDGAIDVSATDQLHLTDAGSAYVADRLAPVLLGKSAASAGALR